jgi:hypothetical protein
LYKNQREVKGCGKRIRRIGIFIGFRRRQMRLSELNIILFSIMRRTLPLIAGVSIFLTFSISEAQQCFELFRLPSQGPQKSVIVTSGADPNDFVSKAYELVKEDPSQLAAKVAEFIEIGKLFLDSEGVQYKVLHGSHFEVIQVTASQATPLNRFALLMQKKYRTKIIFDPATLIKDGSTAYMQEADSTLVSAYSFLGLPFNNIVNAGTTRFLRDTNVLHELRHLEMYRSQIDRVPNPLYGDVEVKDGFLPDDLNGPIRGYENYMSFSELKTYHTQIKQELTQLRSLVRRHQSPMKILEIQNQIVTKWIYLSSLAFKTSYVAKLLEETTDSKITYKLGPGEVVIATIETTASHPPQLEVSLPLIRSKGLNDPQNAHLLKIQTQWLLQTTENVLQQTAGTLQYIFKIQDIDLDSSHIYLIDEIQRGLNVIGLYPPEPVKPLE